MRRGERPLTAEQLADLVNYVLGLPVRCVATNKILKDRIPLFVVRTWEAWHEGFHVQRWCEGVLITYQVLPRPNWWHGRYAVPPQIAAWVS